jgi:nucleoside-diphosphate-sugar epimerase
MTEQRPGREARRALVTGATGVIGPDIVRALLNRGYRVRALNRNAPPRDLLPAEAEVVTGSVTDRGAVRAAMQEVDVVFHLAAKLHINSPDPALADEYRQVNVEGTRVVAEEARDAGVRRVVFFSTIAVYGPSVPGAVLSEESPIRPETVYGSTKAEAETLIRTLCHGPDGAPFGVVLRISAVYGPRVKGNYRQLIRWLRRGVFVPIGAGTNRRSLIHEEDVAVAALLAAEHPAAAGGTFNVTDGAVHTFREIIAAISRPLGRRPPRLHVPMPAALAAATAVDAGLALAGRPRKVAALIRKQAEDMAVDGTRIRQALGFLPRYDLRAGWAATVAALHD